jgi:hypothetical protein
MYQQVKPMSEGQLLQCVKRIADNAFIPFDTDNTDYATYLAWLAEGNTPEPADVPPPPTVQEQLATLDADNMLTQRNLREAIMLMAEAFKAVSNNAVDLTAIPGVAKVYQVEAEAAQLRAQL